MNSKKGFVGLMAAETISLIGGRMTFLALPWLVLATTGSATLTGVTAFAEMMPYVLISAGGGPLVDRLGARRTAIAADVASLALVGAIPLLYRSGGLSFAALVALVALAGSVRGLGDSGKRVLFPQVVAKAGVDLTRATAIHDGLSRAAGLVGAPAAGVLIAFTDAPTVLLLDAVSFGAAALIVSLFVRVSRVATDDDGPPSYLGKLSEGLRFVRHSRLTLGLLGMLFATNLLDQAYSAVLVPVWAKEVFGSPIGAGLVFGAFAGGAVAGNLVYVAVATRLPRFLPFALGFLIGGMPRFVSLAFDSPLWILLSVAFAAGAGLSVVNPILGAVMYELVPERLQARVLGLATALAWAGIPLGSLLGGGLVDATSPRTALIVFGIAYLGATLLPFTGRSWRELDRPAPSIPPQAAPPDEAAGAPRDEVADLPAVEAMGQHAEGGDARR